MKETRFTVVECIAEDDNIYAASVLRRGQFFYTEKEGDKARLFYCKEPSDYKGQQAIAIEIRREGLFEYNIHDNILVRLVSEVYIEWRK